MGVCPDCGSEMVYSYEHNKKTCISCGSKWFGRNRSPKEEDRPKRRPKY